MIVHGDRLGVEGEVVGESEEEGEDHAGCCQVQTRADGVAAE